MTHKDLQKSTTGTLWFDAGSKYIVDLGIFNVLTKSCDAITKFLVTKFKLPFEITWSKTNFFPWSQY